MKRPGEDFELVVVGGATMAIDGFKDQTKDIDIIRPVVLPEPIQNGVTHIGRIRRLSPGWLNSDATPCRGNHRSDPFCVKHRLHRNEKGRLACRSERPGV